MSPRAQPKGPPRRRGRAVTEPDALSALTRLCRARERSRAEIEVRLEARGFTSKEIAAAVERAVHLGYLDDRRAATALVQRQLESGAGRVLIAHKLEELGIAAPLISEILSELPPDSHLARAALSRRFRATAPTLWQLARFLASRGYDEDLVDDLVGTEPRSR